MISDFLFAAAVGALVGFASATLAARRARQFLFVTACGLTGSSLWALAPLIMGHGYVGGGLKVLTLSAAVFSGLGILFMRPAR